MTLVIGEEPSLKNYSSNPSDQSTTRNISPLQWQYASLNKTKSSSSGPEAAPQSLQIILTKNPPPSTQVHQFLIEPPCPLPPWAGGPTLPQTLYLSYPLGLEYKPLDRNTQSVWRDMDIQQFLYLLQINIQYYCTRSNLGTQKKKQEGPGYCQIVVAGGITPMPTWQLFQMLHETGKTLTLSLVKRES